MSGKIQGRSNDGKIKNNERNHMIPMVVAVAVARAIMAAEDADAEEVEVEEAATIVSISKQLNV
jgi:hypothetical protein